MRAVPGAVLMSLSVAILAAVAGPLGQPTITSGNTCSPNWSFTVSNHLAWRQFDYDSLLMSSIPVRAGARRSSLILPRERIAALSQVGRQRIPWWAQVPDVQRQSVEHQLWGKTIATGWPMACIRGSRITLPRLRRADVLETMILLDHQSIYEDEAPKWIRAAVPYGLLARGLFIDTLCWLIVWIIVRGLFIAVRTAFRRRKGLCPDCCYPVSRSYSPICPECGKQIPGAEHMACPPKPDLGAMRAPMDPGWVQEALEDAAD